jgi:hypothetical protein
LVIETRLFCAGLYALEAMLAHEPSDPISAANGALREELVPDAQDTIAALMQRKDLSYLLQKLFITALALAGSGQARLPTVIA